MTYALTIRAVAVIQGRKVVILYTCLNAYMGLASVQLAALVSIIAQLRNLWTDNPMVTHVITYIIDIVRTSFYRIIQIMRVCGECVGRHGILRNIEDISIGN